MTEDPNKYKATLIKGPHSLKTSIHTAAVDVVVRFLESMDSETAREAINIYLNK